MFFGTHVRYLTAAGIFTVPPFSSPWTRSVYQFASRLSFSMTYATTYSLFLYYRGLVSSENPAIYLLVALSEMGFSCSWAQSSTHQRSSEELRGASIPKCSKNGCVNDPSARDSRMRKSKPKTLGTVFQQLLRCLWFGKISAQQVVYVCLANFDLLHLPHYREPP